MSNLPKHLPKNLFYFRRLKGLRQDQMRSHIDCSRTTWSNYENGLSQPSISLLIQISKFFGVTLDDLVLKDFYAEKKDIPLFKKKRTKGAIYQEVDAVSQSVEEYDLKYIVKEIKKLRAEMNSIKDGFNH